MTLRRPPLRFGEALYLVAGQPARFGLHLVVRPSPPDPRYLVALAGEGEA